MTPPTQQIPRLCTRDTETAGLDTGTRSALQSFGKPRIIIFQYQSLTYLFDSGPLTLMRCFSNHEVLFN